MPCNSPPAQLLQLFALIALSRPAAAVELGVVSADQRARQGLAGATAPMLLHEYTQAQAKEGC